MIFILSNSSNISSTHLPLCMCLKNPLSMTIKCLLSRLVLYLTCFSWIDLFESDAFSEPREEGDFASSEPSKQTESVFSVDCLLLLIMAFNLSECQICLRIVSKCILSRCQILNCKQTLFSSYMRQESTNSQPM